MLKKSILALAISGLCVSVFASTKYNIDAAHSTVGFKVTHLMISTVPGRFDKFEGNFSLDEKTGKVEGLNAKIDLDSVNTNEPKRDSHLKTADFFGVRTKEGKLVEDKRWMTFKSTKVDVKGNKPNTITGDLTINGVTKPVTLKVEQKGPTKDPWGNTRVGFEATTKINRKDFGITFNKALETGGVMVGDDVDIAINGEAVAEAAPSAPTAKK
jgi:polyisoprenoid-binding protein YceI